MKADHCLFSQHLPGSINSVADQLTFTSQTREGKINLLADDSPCNAELTDRCHALMPQLIPEPFVISQLPDEILSFVVLVLRTMESSMTPSAKQLSSARTGHGVVGSGSATQPDRSTTPQSYFRAGTRTTPPIILLLLPDSRLVPLRRPLWNPFEARKSVDCTKCGKQPGCGVSVAIPGSPLHVQGSTQLLPSLRSLSRVFDNIDPPPNRQKAITPRFLRALHRLGGAGIRPNAYDHTMDMIIVTFFFDMRSCEYCIPTTPGRTKTLCLRHLVFRDKRMRVIPHTHPRLEQVAEYITNTFEDQKNGIKMDSRSQRRMGDHKLCPTTCLGRAVRRIVSTGPGWTKDTLLCRIRLRNKNQQITNTFTKRLLHHTCQLYGGHNTLGFHPQEIEKKLKYL
jgi:hypothetical protein